MSDTTASVPVREFEGVSIPNPGTYHFDPAHSAVSFRARHLMVSKVRGSFTSFEGTVTVGEQPLESSVNVRIDVASVETGEPQRDGHLRSGDFFGAETYPTIEFASTGIRHDRGERFTVTGDLTVRGVTKEVQLDAEFLGVLVDPWGNQRFGISASTDLDREAFGLTWNQVLEGGGVLVGKQVRIEIDAELVREPD